MNPPNDGSANPPGGPPEGERNRRRRRSDSRGQQLNRRQRARRTGRPLGNAERMYIFGVWSLLSPDARRSLYDNLGGMLGETPAAAPRDADAGAAQEQEEDRPANQPRIRVWQREVLRDIPLFARFGQLTAAQRGADDQGIPRLLSISTGVVARGRARGATDQEISTALIGTLPDVDRTHALYQEPINGDQDGGDADPMSEDHNSDAGEDQ
jgi:hypothetical protein